MPQRQKESQRANDRPLTKHEQYELSRHLFSLKLRDKESYQVWCTERGFEPGLRKTEPHRRKELQQHRLEMSKIQRARLSKNSRSPDQLLSRVLSGEAEEELLSPEWARVAELSKTLGKKQGSRDAFESLVKLALKKTKLFDATPVIGTYSRGMHNCMLGALASLATYHEVWIRSADQFKPKSKSARKQLGELTRFLLAKYEVPSFMDSVWFKRSRTQGWFIHMGRGQNIRTARRLFVPLTRKMAHCFLGAPGDYTVEQAFRWAQVHGLGGNRRVTEAVYGTRLGREFKNDDFWSTVIRFFIANPMLDTAHYGPIVDYIHHQKFASERIFMGPGRVEETPPPHPGFSMRKRNPERLLRQVEVWHRGLGRVRETGDHAWDSSGIPEFVQVEGRDKKRRWTIQELLSINALRNEGRTMGHCIASYAGSCASGRSSVWTLRLREPEGDQWKEVRHLTIEVRPQDRVIVEARGRFNAYPTPQQMRILQQWTQQENLSLPSYIAG
ncbi:MAG: PcfJ domain-containing protein [Deltaproteobacteria bacterium]|nr:PcfJ domain-containing protein [Deltaproteobacteria bacterium]